MTTINVGIIGAGNMGRTHANILKEDERVKIVGITDVVSAKAQELAESLGARAFPDVDALLDSGVEAVYVATPNTRHVPAALVALAKNIHVFSEKPMATSME
jgi:myo-inositol 2-dehydrogenase/D-chiro-inositol 1-dehydrogenase